MAVPYSEVLQAAQDYVNSNLEGLKEKSWSGIGKSMGTLKQSPALRWASMQDIKAAIEQAYTQYFGSKEEAQAKQTQLAQKVSLVSRSHTHEFTDRRDNRKNKLRKTPVNLKMDLPRRQWQQTAQHPPQPTSQTTACSEKVGWPSCTSLEKTLRSNLSSNNNILISPRATSSLASHPNRMALCILAVNHQTLEPLRVTQADDHHLPTQI